MDEIRSVKFDQKRQKVEVWTSKGKVEIGVVAEGNRPGIFTSFLTHKGVKTTWCIRQVQLYKEPKRYQLKTSKAPKWVGKEGDKLNKTLKERGIDA